MTGPSFLAERRVTFRCEDIVLEGVVHSGGTEDAHPGIVVCHPHPLYGGDMDNIVVMAVCQAFARTGMTALRFNFRGVGGSGGNHGEGVAEQQDVRAALDYLLSLPGVDAERVGLAGYSFGALVAAAVAPAYTRLRALALISPPARALDGSKLATLAAARLIAVGDSDQFAPEAELRRIADSMPQPTELVVVAGADHFWMGRTAELARQVADFFSRYL